MDVNQKRLAGLAARIHSDLAQSRFNAMLKAFPQTQFDQVRRSATLLERARGRRWDHSTQRLLDNYYSTLVHVDRECGQIREQLALMRSPRPLMNPRDIYHDLLTLQQDVEQLTWNRKKGTLSVTSETIELEGCYLGSFDIELSWRQIGQGVAYRVIALDPQPAAGNSSVTHPHVQDEHVCEGDATLPIQSALASGRLLDFFTIVRQLLQTYNSASPYVALTRWDGAICHECDSTVYEDDGCNCDRCEALMCDDCYRRCGDCGEPCCSGCSDRCQGCQEDTCHRCHRTCVNCDDEYCVNCLTDDERCDTCHENHENEEESYDNTAATAVHADGVGETVVSA